MSSDTQYVKASGMSKRIHLPASIDSLRVKHLKTIKRAAKDQDNFYKLETRLKMVSDFTGITEAKLRDYSAADVGKVFNHILNLYNSYEQSDPPRSITLDGQRYDLINDIGKTMPAGWFIDVDSFKDDFEDRPELLAAFSYLEHGTKYGEANEHDALLYPLEDRAKVMAEHLPLPIYLDLSAFFLTKFNKLELGYLSLQAVRLREATDQVKVMAKELTGSKS